MSPLQKSNNLAARMGRWSASHWKTAVFGWLALVAVAVFVGQALGTKHIAAADRNTGESRRGDHIFDAAGFDVAERHDEYVLIQSKTLRARDPEFRAAIRDTVAAVRPHTGVGDVRSPLAAGNRGQISADGHSAYVSFEIAGDEKLAQDRVDPIVASVAKVQAAHPGLSVRETGDASAGKALEKLFSKQMQQAETLSLPITLVILLFVFGAIVAAGLPLLLAASAVLATLGLVSLPSHLLPMDKSVSEVILLVGLAVGVDYSLFYLKREREERAAGRGHRAALEAAAATSGRAVLISGMTVIIAMAGLFFSGDRGFMSMGVGTMLVVAVAMLGSLTVLPALLSRLGDRVEKGRIPFLHRYLRRNAEPRFWRAILRPVLRHPLLATILSAGALVALTVPAFGLHTSISGLDALPKSVAEVQTLDRFQEAFPGGPQPALVAVRAKSLDTPAVRSAAASLEAKALASGEMQNLRVLKVNPDRTVAMLAVDLQGGGTDARSEAALATLRQDLLPQTLGKVAGVEYAVTGMTANSHDYNSVLKSHAPYVVAFVLLFAFLLLLASFRSIVIAIKAVLLNLLSVGAASGLLVLVFQKGWGEGILNFESNGGIAAWLPIFMFVILFGLSMDYHVFILSRIREAFDRGMKTKDAVEHGITTTAGVVTSAAAVMVGAFAVFATLPLVDMKELGVGLAAAVIIDATIVRAVLLPAAMKLLGEWNWYLPRWLEWLPRLEHEAPAAKGAPAAPAALPARAR